MPSANATRERPTAERRKINVNTRNAANKEKTDNNRNRKGANKTRKANANAVQIRKPMPFKRCR
jgi:hypothetical protein